MSDYDLSRLSNRSFEHLVQALAAKVLGSGIVVFGDGPDGGREATFERRVAYPTTVEGWDGYGVVQAKFRQRLVGTQQDGSWAIDQLKDEVLKYTDPESNLRTPEYFIFATNVVLTPVRETGFKDRAIAVLEDFKKQASLKDYAIWDYDQIRIFLDNNEDVRKSYAAFITPGDVLSEIISQLSPSPADMYDTLAIFLEKELLSDECVNLEQAGHSVDERIPLATVFVDLPTHDESDELRTQILSHSDIGDHEVGTPIHAGEGFIKSILAAASGHLAPASFGSPVLSSQLDSGVPRESHGRFVLIGGPGQGKTTLTQFICQIFRAANISGKPPHTLSPATKSALATLQRHCELEGINHDAVPRFPFKLVLNDFAKALSPTSPSSVNSVLGYLSLQVRNRTDSDISPNDLRRFLGRYPSVIVFDGLDEVPASSNRDQVMDAIRDFWIDASNANADILSIATSRPQGYNEDFSPLHYQHLQLAELSGQLGWHFAQRLADVRYGTEEDRKQKVLNRLERAFQDDSTSRLMKSPLQVTIMTALVDRIGQPPQARWDLFNSYYEVIYLREVERNIPASNILRDYRPDIRAIHNQVGLILQIDSERTGRTDAKLSRDRFVTLVETRLNAEGHTGKRLSTLAQEIVEAASQRLVFLVEVESEQIGFEIRSLQEFMAAESLMDGVDQSIRERLDEIAPIPFWRNVFLFAAGKCFAVRQELRDAVHSICNGLNMTQGNEIAGTYLAGSALSVALLEEGSSRRQPKFEDMIARTAIRALDVANPDLQIRLADVYESQLEDIYQDAIELRLASGNRVRSMGAWNCLLRLAAADVPWAVRSANAHWPADYQHQVQVLQAIAEPTKNYWASEKLLQLIPRAPVSTFSEVLETETRRQWSEVHNVETELKAAVSIIRSRMRPVGRQVNVLSTGLSYGPIVRLGGSENTDLQRLRSIDGWDSSWLAYKCGGDFLSAPSRESLASALTSLAAVFPVECDVSWSFEWRCLPWPILACLNSCTSGRELLDLAGKASRGELGDAEDWIAAETRWFEDGIVRDDLTSMSDDRLPFDAAIRHMGFPTTLATLSPILAYQDNGWTLGDVLDVYESLPPGNTRSFVAATINWLILAHAIPLHRVEAATLPAIGLRALESIYREVPVSSPVPLHALVNLISNSISDATAFFGIIKDKMFLVDMHNADAKLVGASVAVLARAHLRLDPDNVVLPLLGAIAEHGQLGGNYIDVGELESLEAPASRQAALLVTLSQESWRTDSSERLIAFAQRIVDSRRDVFGRIVTTLENNRPVGDYADKFVAALEQLIPEDDYRAHKRYISLLEETLGRRTSQFADPFESARFAMPAGVLELLKR